VRPACVEPLLVERACKLEARLPRSVERAEPRGRRSIARRADEMVGIFDLRGGNFALVHT
jgi:hypothetical protein